jgi:hypothetical protein
VANSFFSIETVTIGTGSQTSVTFSNIPQDYTHLQIRALQRDNRAVTINSLNLRFNSDTGSNYSMHYLDGSGSAASSSAATNQTNMSIGNSASNSLLANTFSVHIADILDYRDTNKYKTVRALYGVDSNSTTGYVGMHSGNWRSTAAINSLTIFVNSATALLQYTSFALYGVKA